ncbi:MAG TPA: hypothetical protein VFE24_16275 [Pirellulales bacterium]|nr:hypothetical protein [Pirellulales bacterium]
MRRVLLTAMVATLVGLGGVFMGAGTTSAHEWDHHGWDHHDRYAAHYYPSYNVRIAPPTVVGYPPAYVPAPEVIVPQPIVQPAPRPVYVEPRATFTYRSRGLSLGIGF